MPTRIGQAASRLGPQIGVRARSVAIAVIVVLIAILIGGSGLVYALWSNLEQSAEATARTQAAEVVSQITTDGIAVTLSTLRDESGGEAVIQILSADGEVVGSSRRSATSALSPLRPPVGQTRSVERDLDILNEGGEWKVVTTAVAPAGATHYVEVAVPIRIQRQTVQTVASYLLGGTPVLLGAVAAAVWILVGRALRAVEQIRNSVAEIDARRLADRIDVPPSRDEIAALAQTMNVMLDRLQASDRAQRAFVSDASHELRSPLATLSTAAELAERSHDETTRTRLLQTMNSELTRMRGLVENLMTLARTDADDPATQATDIDLDDLLDHEARRLRATGQHQIQLTLEPVRITAEMSRVAQPLRNLVDNAERHALTTIRLSLLTGHDQAVIWVENDGPTIALPDRERIFERFVRLDDSRSRDAGGSGLGLAISRAGLRSQGGDVTVVDAPDGWCRFQVTLPLTTPV